MIDRRTIMLAATALLAACSPAERPETPPPDESASRAVTDPAAVIRPLYDPYLTEGATFPSFHDQAPWSAAMWAQLEAMTARSQAIGEPILDFDPLIDAQDYKLSDLNVVNEAIAEGSHAVVRASFTNAASPTEVVYDLVWEDDRWKVDNIRGSSWNLRQIATGAPQ